MSVRRAFVGGLMAGMLLRRHSERHPGRHGSVVGWLLFLAFVALVVVPFIYSIASGP